MLKYASNVTKRRKMLHATIMLLCVLGLADAAEGLLLMLAWGPFGPAGQWEG